MFSCYFLAMAKVRKSIGEYDLFLPLATNKGQKISPRVLNGIKQELIEEFGGVTDFRHHNEGHWRVGHVTFRDDIIIYRVLAEKPASARRFLKRLQRALEKELEQEEILIVERKVRQL